MHKESERKHRRVHLGLNWRLLEKDPRRIFWVCWAANPEALAPEGTPVHFYDSDVCHGI